MEDVNYNNAKWLFRYIKTEIRSVRRAVDKLEATNRDAVKEVKDTYGEYRAQQNEWRGQLKDERITLASQVEVDGLRAQLAANSKFMNMIVGGLVVLQFLILVAVSIWLKK